MTLKERLINLTHSKQKSIMSATIVLGITFILSALLGFLRTRILYDHFFRNFTLELDAFNAAFRIPDLIFRLLVSGALSASFIPVYASALHKDKQEADRIASVVINILFLLFITVSLIIFIFATPICHLIAPGFSVYQLGVMISLTRILIIAQVFFLLSAFFTSILQVNQMFLLPALSPIIYNLVIIASIYLFSSRFGLFGIAWGTVVGAFLHLLIQIPGLKRQGFTYQLIFNYRLKGVKEIIKLMVPQTISIGVNELGNTLDILFTSYLVAGSLSLLNLAFQLMYLPSRIFSNTVGQASLPILSKYVAKDEMDKFKKIVNKTILQSLFLALPIAILILVLRLDLVRLVFGTKRFPWAATKTTALALGFLTPIIVCQTIIQIIIRAFYALHNTKIPLISATMSLLIYIFTSIFVINYTNLAVAGLALSTSLGDVLQCICLVYFYYKKVDNSDWKIILFKLLKILFAAIMAGLIAWCSLRFFDSFIFDTSKAIDVFLIFAVSSISGLIGYILFSIYLHIEELDTYTRQLIKLKHFIYRR